MKLKANNRWSNGFTLVEVLAVTAILVILLAVGAVAVVHYANWLRITELDNTAREIYLAAENRAVLLHNGGRLQKALDDASGGEFIPKAEDGGTEGLALLAAGGGEEEGAYYYISYSAGDTGVLDDLLPEGSVDPALRKGHFYIAYEAESGSVTDVFYTEDAKMFEGGFQATYDTLRGASRSARLDGKKMVGYYGSEAAEADKSQQLYTPDIQVFNEETLRVQVTYRTPMDIGAGETTLSVSVEYGGFPVELDLDGAKREESFADGRRVYSYTWVLDAVDGPHFADLFKGVANGPKYFGGDFGVRADLRRDGVPSTASYWDCNSLFANGSNGDTAYIENLRHLQNLDSAFSNAASTGAERKTQAVQRKDIDCADEAYNGHAFRPIVNSGLESFDGGGHTIKNLNVTEMSAAGKPGAGLFAEGDGKTFTNIHLKNAAVAGGSLPAGAVVGHAQNAQFDGCWVYWEPETGSTLNSLLCDADGGLDYQIAGETAGGLAGELTGTATTIENCLSATLVKGDVAGGLAGSAEGVTVTGSYADCYLSGKTAAGLVGSTAGAAAITDAYAAGFIQAEDTAGGLCLGAGTVTAENVYSAVRYPSMDSGSIVPLAEDLGAGSRKCHYLRYTLNDEHSEAMTFEAMVADGFVEQMGGSFARKSQADSSPYNLGDLSLTVYDFPGLKELPHYGDWGAEFLRASLVYFEEYQERGGAAAAGSRYGFRGGNVACLRNDADVVLDGYAVAMRESDLGAGGGDLTIHFVYQDKDGARAEAARTYSQDELCKVSTGEKDEAGKDVAYYLAPLPDELINSAYASPDLYQYLSFTLGEGQGAETAVYAYTPHLAVVPAGLPSDATMEGLGDHVNGSRADIRVRTPRHLYWLSVYPQYYHSGFGFRQELDLDYDVYTAYQGSGGALEGYQTQDPIGLDESLPFNGVYNGGCRTIQGVKFRFATGTGQVYAGLFGYSAGTLQDIVYLMDMEKEDPISLSIQRQGQEPFIGGLAGGNAGTIFNCAVAGVDMEIHAYRMTFHAGGLVGRNQGTIRACEAELAYLMADNSSFASCSIGGLVGRNETNGIITTSYAVGHIYAGVDEHSSAAISGYAGNNLGYIGSSYAAVRLQSSGRQVETYGFCGGRNGRQEETYYLNDGNFTYRDEAYNANYPIFKAQPIKYADLVQPDADGGAEGCPVPGMTWDVAAIGGYDGEAGYPYPSALKDTQGKPVHYGCWPKTMKLGIMGVYYWEKLEVGGKSAYNVSLLAVDPAQETVTKQSTLSNAHSDNGVVTDYGYGYYAQEDAAKVTLTAADISYADKGDGTVGKDFTTSDPAKEDAAVDKVLAELMPGYTFHSYHSYGMGEGGGGLYPSSNYTDPSHKTFSTSTSGTNWTKVNIKDYTRKPNGIFTLEQGGTKVSFTLNPHFADALAVELPSGWGNDCLKGGASTVAPGDSGENPYEVRALSQLQNINWNVRPERDSNNVQTRLSNSIVVSSSDSGNFNGNQYGFLYLSHDTRWKGDGVTEGSYNYSWSELYEYHWVQTHDIDGRDSSFTPIAAFEDRTTNEGGGESQQAGTTILTAWFGGTYDGGDYTIKNIDIGAKDANCVGLFGVTMDATLKNIILYSDSGLNTITVSGRSSYNRLYSWYAAGGLVGLAAVSDQKKGNDEFQSISNCTVAGYTIVDKTQYAGSFDITNKKITDGTSYGGGAVGGLVGVCNLDLTNCTATTTIRLEYARNGSSPKNSPVRVGGLAGSCVASVSNCYAGGEIAAGEQAKSGNIYMGGLVGGTGMRPMYVPYYKVSAFAHNVAIQDSYSTMTLPGKKDAPDQDAGDIMARYAVGGNGANSSFTVDLGNCYALSSGAEEYDDAAGVTLVTYSQLKGDAEIEGGAKIYDLLTGFSPVTGASAGVPGKYSYAPTVTAPHLQGLDYPFPTILTREGGIHVHYGRWPLAGIKRVNGGKPIELDLFVKGEGEDAPGVATEELALELDVLPNGTWSIQELELPSEGGEPAQPVVAAEIDQTGLLTLTGLRTGLAEVTVLFTPDGGGEAYQLILSVRVTAELDLLPERTPVYLFTNDTTEVPLVPVGRDGVELGSLAELGIELEDIQTGESVLLSTHELIRDEASGTAVLKLASGGEAGDDPLIVTGSYIYNGVKYHLMSTVNIVVVEPEIEPGVVMFGSQGTQDDPLTVTVVQGKTKIPAKPAGAPGVMLEFMEDQPNRIGVIYQGTETIKVQAVLRFQDKTGAPVGGEHTVIVEIPPPAAPDGQALEPDPEAQAIESDPASQDLEPAPASQDLEPAPEAQALEPAPEAQAIEPDPDAQDLEPAPDTEVKAAGGLSAKRQLSMERRALRETDTGEAAQSEWGVDLARAAVLPAVLHGGRLCIDGGGVQRG